MNIELSQKIGSYKSDISCLIDHLGELIEDQEKTYGLLGSMGYARQQLINAVSHLGGLTEREVVKTLKDIS